MKTSGFGLAVRFGQWVVSPPLRRVVAVSLLLLSGGCLSRPALVKQSFAFPLPTLKGNLASAHNEVLEIRQIRVASPYDNQSFIYRTGAYSYEIDPYAGFLVSAQSTFFGPIAAYWRQAEVFRDVVSPESAAKPAVIADITISELYGDFRNRSAPAAVLRMHFIFRRSQHGAAGPILIDKEYQQRVALKARTAAALMAGWNEGLKRILADTSADLKALNS